MTPAVLDRPTLFERTTARPAPLRARAGTQAPAFSTGTGTGAGTIAAPARTSGDGRPSLEGVIAGTWEGLAAHREAGCPLCGGSMAPRYGAAGVAPVGGRCGDCGTTLG